MTVSQQGRLLVNSQDSARQTKGRTMMSVGFRCVGGGNRRHQNWRLNHSVNQSEESTAERRARAAAFASEFESAAMRIQTKPLRDRELIVTGNSQPISCPTEMNFERTDFFKVLSQKCFKPISAERLLNDQSLKSIRMVQRANRQRGVR